MVQSQGLSLSFSSESSIQKELTRESAADARTILVYFGHFHFVIILEKYLISNVLDICFYFHVDKLCSDVCIYYINAS
jgi:hypothetical protein